MVIQITGRHIDVSDKLKSYIESRVQKIGRYIDGITDIHVTLSAEKHRHIAELNVHSSGKLFLSARESSDDMKLAVSQAVEKLEGQAKKQQEKRIDKKRRRSAKPDGEGTFNVIAPEPDGATPGEPRVVESRRFVIKPLTVEEAVLAIEDDRAEFLVFKNAASSRTNVLYRRPDGNFGLIDPDR